MRYFRPPGLRMCLASLLVEEGLVEEEG